jgi:AcrR family transcriptional regulator
LSRAHPAVPGEQDSTEPATSQRDRIRQTAARLFVRHGYEVTSMKLLAKELRMVPANLYNYYPNKQAILFDVLTTQLARFLERQTAILAKADHPVATLRALAHDLVMSDLTDPFGAFLTDHGLNWLTRANRKRVSEQMARVRAIWLDTIRTGQSSGIFREDPAKLATLIVLTLCSYVSTWFDPDGQFTAKEVADYTASAVIRCLRDVKEG